MISFIVQRLRSLSGLFRRKPESFTIDDALGVFTLENPKKDNAYEGMINWLGAEALVDLETDGTDNHTADTALGNLRRIAEETAQWDRRLREYAAEEMSEGDGTVEIWEGDGDNDADYSYITKEEFISRLSIGFIRINKDGTIVFYYDMDEMFTDHTLEIRANISGEIRCAGLCGWEQEGDGCPAIHFPRPGSFRPHCETTCPYGGLSYQCEIQREYGRLLRD